MRLRCTSGQQRTLGLWPCQRHHNLQAFLRAAHCQGASSAPLESSTTRFADQRRQQLDTLHRFATSGRDRHAAQKAAQQLSASILLDGTRLSFEDWALCIWSHGKLRLGLDSALMQRARGELITCFKHAPSTDVSPEQIARVAWGLARLRYCSIRLWIALVWCAAKQVPAFTPQAFSVVVWAAATTGANTAPLLRSKDIAQHIASPACTSQALTHICWGAARSGYTRPQLYKRISAALRARDWDLLPRQVTNILWGLARGGLATQPVPAVLRLLAQGEQLGWGRFSTSELCTSVWAASRVLGSVGGEHLAGALQEVHGRQGQLQAQDISQVASACVSLQGRHRQLLRMLQQEALPLVPSMAGQAAANILFCMAARHAYCPHLFAAAAARLAACAEAAEPPLRALVIAAAALRAVRHYDAAFLDALSRAAVAGSSGMSPMDMATLALVYADMRHHAPDLFAAIIPVAQAELEGQRMGVREVANLAWGFAVAQHQTELLPSLFAALQEQQHLRERPFVANVQLMQAQMLVRDVYVHLVALPTMMPQQLYKNCRSAWVCAAQASEASPSAIAVAQVLESMGLAVQLECMTADSLFCFDIALQYNGRQVAIEVDGVQHFTRNPPFHPLGRTIAKRRCLGLRGWWVISIPTFHWCRLTTPQQRVEYLTLALEGTLWRSPLLEQLHSNNPGWLAAGEQWHEETGGAA